MISDNLSHEFIEKYKFCPTTNKVLHMLNNGNNPLAIIESILTAYEDLQAQVNKDKLDELNASEIKTFECYNCHVVNPIRINAK